MASQRATTDSCLQLADRVGRSALNNSSNFVLSPLAIRAALSLAAAGSNGDTLAQFLSFLGSPTIGDLSSAASDLLRSVRSTRPAHSSAGAGGSRLSFVSGIWVDRSTPLKASFENVAGTVYDAVVESVKFQTEAPEVAVAVNAWVEKATEGLIKDLIPPESVNHLTRVVLANALYFRGIWADKFNKSDTRNEEFHLLDGSTIQIPFMTKRDKQFISSFHGFKVLRLPYEKEGGERSFSMILFLPDKMDGIHSLLEMATYDPDFFNRHVPIRRVEVGDFMIPKFKISTQFEPSKFLKNLGLDIPFCKERADFTEMVRDSSQRLFVSSIHHKATIEVEEEGTTAAAATGMVMSLLCYVPPTNFVADHPFMFAIREDETGALLFLGHVANPSVEDTSL